MMQDKRPDVSIIIINYRTAELTHNAVSAARAVMENSENSFEIIVVDNHSGDGSYDALRRLEDERVHVWETERNGGFSYGNNYGAARAGGRYLFFLNSDTVLYPNVLPQMLAYMDLHADVGALSCLMEDGEGCPLVTGHRFENAWTLFLQTIVKPLLPRALYQARNKQWQKASLQAGDCDWVSGAALLTPRNVFDSVGGWNEAFFLYMEDEELCWRISQAGHKVQIYPALGLAHLVGKSGGTAFVVMEKYKSQKKFFSNAGVKHRRLVNALLYLQMRQSAKKLSDDEREKMRRGLRSTKNG